jgi:CheY-like chemotaxis protein
MGSSPTRGSEIRHAVVLLVDDSHDERDMYTAQLEADGFQVLQAENALDGFEMALKYFPDVVITDVAMPGAEDGFALVKRLKQEPRTSRTPVVVLTGHAFEVHRDEARRAKCDLFLAKPCLPSDLEAAIRELLGRTTKLRQASVRKSLRDKDSAARSPLRKT